MPPLLDPLLTELQNTHLGQDMQSYPDPTAVAGEGGGPFYSPGNNQQQRLSNPDELQLAAQLSRGLEPMANTASGGSMNDASEASGQGNPNLQYSQEQQLHPQMTSGGMDQSPYNMGDSSMTPRKRSKVSRACDECRRKKIRCDATSESGDEQCTSCKRVGSRCQFSRVPMKRGPSKGYIKELADRLNTLEGAMQSGEIPPQGFAPLILSRRASNEYSPPPGALDSSHQRKRTYSTISNEFSPGFQPQRQSLGWPQVESQRHLPPLQSAYQNSPPASDPNHSVYRPAYSPNGLAPQPSWRSEPEVALRPNSSYDLQEQNHSDYKSEWNDNIVDGFYKDIQPTLPFLPYSKSRLCTRLGNCSPALREAFLDALNVTVRSIPTSNLPPYPELQNARRTANLIFTLSFEDSATRNATNSLVYMSTLILMAIEAGIRGPPTPHTGPSQAVWLGMAIGLAYQLKFNIPMQKELRQEGDDDSDEKLARRIWLTLVILEKFHSSSTSSPGLIPDAATILLPEDEKMLGDANFHFTRLALILGQVSQALIYREQEVASGTSSAAIPQSFIGALLFGQIERFRESFPNTVTPASSPLCHLAYWHTRLLIKRAGPQDHPDDAKDLLKFATEVAELLAANPTLLTPLTHHFTSLATISLVDLLDNELTRESAELSISIIMDSRIAPSGWDGTVRDLVLRRQSPSGASQPITDSTPLASLHALTASQGLQHLADLATATEASRSDVLSDARTEKSGTGLGQGLHPWEPPSTNKSGYLTLLAREVDR